MGLWRPVLVWALQSQDWLGRGHPSLSLDPPFLHSTELTCLCLEPTTSLPPGVLTGRGSCWLFPALCQGYQTKSGGPGQHPVYPVATQAGSVGCRQVLASQGTGGL